MDRLVSDHVAQHIRANVPTATSVSDTAAGVIMAHELFGKLDDFDHALKALECQLEVRKELASTKATLATHTNQAGESAPAQRRGASVEELEAKLATLRDIDGALGRVLDEYTFSIRERDLVKAVRAYGIQLCLTG